MTAHIYQTFDVLHANKRHSLTPRNYSSSQAQCELFLVYFSSLNTIGGLENSTSYRMVVKHGHINGQALQVLPIQSIYEQILI